MAIAAYRPNYPYYWEELWHPLAQAIKVADPLETNEARLIAFADINGQGGFWYEKKKYDRGAFEYGLDFICRFCKTSIFKWNATALRSFPEALARLHFRRHAHDELERILRENIPHSNETVRMWQDVRLGIR